MLRKYGTATTIYFPLIDAGTRNFAGSGDYTHVSGDVRISKDGAASATANGTPTVVTMNNGSMWKLALTATEMEAKTVVVTIIDAATKAIEDQMIVIETYGTGNGEVDTVEFADALLNRNMATGTDSGGRTVRSALRKLRNKVSISGTTLTVTKEDDSTSDHTETLTTSASAEAITASDPD
jgi:hypothetical protein